MYQPTYSRLHRIDLEAECGHIASNATVPASGVELETSTARMALICSARQFGHQLGDWCYGADGRVIAMCAQCDGAASLRSQGAGAIRIEHDIPYVCHTRFVAQRAAG
jgi:hypothetical protein